VRGFGGILLAVVVLALAGCGDEDEPAGTPAVAPADGPKATVYVSLPARGASAAATEHGIRHALREADRQAGRHPIEIVVLPSSRARDGMWSARLVEANARRAAADRSAIAYIGELDRGGSSVSLPITTRAGLLQVSPADGLTSLGRQLPFGSNAHLARYSPGDVSTFARLVPPDLDAARAAAGKIGTAKARRLVVVTGTALADREFAGLVRDSFGKPNFSFPQASSAPRPRTTSLSLAGIHRGAVEAVVARAAAARPDALVLAAGTRRVERTILARLAERLPAVPLYASPSVASAGWPVATSRKACILTGVPPAAKLPPRGREILAELRATGGDDRVEAVLGQAAMRLVLDSIERHGANRAAVVRAARATADHDDVVVGYGLGTRAHHETVSVGCAPPAEP
jgi:branched-chain amino acid transport system substrate-binding protein